MELKVLRVSYEIDRTRQWIYCRRAEDPNCAAGLKGRLAGNRNMKWILQVADFEQTSGSTRHCGRIRVHIIRIEGVESVVHCGHVDNIPHTISGHPKIGNE